MPKTIKKKVQKPKKEPKAKSFKGSSIFDFIDYLTVTKKPWDSLTETDKKAFSPFMIARWLSMNIELTTFVNELQKYTIGLLSPKLAYNLYLDVLPKQKVFLRYVKGSSTDKYNPELVSILKRHYEVSESNILEYLHIFYSNESYKSDLINIIKMYGKNDKECTKLIQIK